MADLQQPTNHTQRSSEGEDQVLPKNKTRRTTYGFHRFSTKLEEQQMVFTDSQPNLKNKGYLQIKNGLTKMKYKRDSEGLMDLPLQMNNNGFLKQQQKTFGYQNRILGISRDKGYPCFKCEMYHKVGKHYR
ncbi:hypothetical protein FRX31_017704 [Thalictrum thalictroides]|uniref:Uncharacterized protein n=1 Tax=Thalictrum thalictroides TaxID=46969 RepID=A0A7J6W5Q4_THATH|nr:hypothetical protein FRX31_017704 [Thalictrum thalictroides]